MNKSMLDNRIKFITFETSEEAETVTVVVHAVRNILVNENNNDIGENCCLFYTFFCYICLKNSVLFLFIIQFYAVAVH